MTYETTQYLVHHGIKGQKWYERRFQNPDGTLTAAGKVRYANSVSEVNRLSAKREKAQGKADAATIRYGDKTAQLESRAARKMMKTNRIVMTNAHRKKLAADAKRLQQRADVGNAAMQKANAKVGKIEAEMRKYEHDIKMLESIADSKSYSELQHIAKNADGWLAGYESGIRKAQGSTPAMFFSKQFKAMQETVVSDLAPGKSAGDYRSEVQSKVKSISNPAMKNAYDSVTKGFKKAQSTQDERDTVRYALQEVEGKVSDAEYKQLEDDFGRMMYGDNYKRRK